MNKRAVIIGAGPAGLASAHCLARRDIEYLVLEQGPGVSAALRCADPEMTLLSPTALSRLPDMADFAKATGYLSFSELVAALERYQTKHDIQLIPNAKVMSVALEGGRFAVHYQTSSGEPRIAEGSHVINGTGIISHPSLPTDFDPRLCSFRWMHSLNVRTDDLKSAGALLVVGGGQSATEVLERWLHVCDPDAKAWISMRSPMRAVPHRVLGIDFHYLIWLPEHLPSQLVGSFIARFREPMVGFSVARAVRRRRILRLPAVATYHGSEVVFADGQCLQPDLVVFATGFQYAADHLGDLVARRADGTFLVRNCESMRTRNLFLLGLRFGRTLASPYLRGIARDAKYVAALIAERGN